MTSATPAERTEVVPARSAPGRMGFVRARPLLVFFVLTFIIAWGFATLMALLGPGHVPATADEFRPYLLYAMLIGFSAPAVSGLLLTAFSRAAWDSAN